MFSSFPVPTMDGGGWRLSIIGRVNRAAPMAPMAHRCCEWCAADCFICRILDESFTVMSRLCAKIGLRVVSVHSAYCIVPTYMVPGTSFQILVETISLI